MYDDFNILAHGSKNSKSVKAIPVLSIPDPVEAYRIDSLYRPPSVPVLGRRLSNESLYKLYEEKCSKQPPHGAYKKHRRKSIPDRLIKKTSISCKKTSPKIKIIQKHLEGKPRLLGSNKLLKIKTKKLLLRKSNLSTPHLRKLKISVGRVNSITPDHAVYPTETHRSNLVVPPKHSIRYVECKQEEEEKRPSSSRKQCVSRLGNEKPSREKPPLHKAPKSALGIRDEVQKVSGKDWKKEKASVAKAKETPGKKRVKQKTECSNKPNYQCGNVKLSMGGREDWVSKKVVSQGKSEKKILKDKKNLEKYIQFENNMKLQLKAHHEGNKKSVEPRKTKTKPKRKAMSKKRNEEEWLDHSFVKHSNYPENISFHDKFNIIDSSSVEDITENNVIHLETFSSNEKGHLQLEVFGSPPSHMPVPSFPEATGKSLPIPSIHSNSKSNSHDEENIIMKKEGHQERFKLMQQKIKNKIKKATAGETREGAAIKIQSLVRGVLMRIRLRKWAQGKRGYQNIEDSNSLICNRLSPQSSYSQDYEEVKRIIGELKERNESKAEMISYEEEKSKEIQIAIEKDKDKDKEKEKDKPKAKAKAKAKEKVEKEEEECKNLHEKKTQKDNKESVNVMNEESLNRGVVVRVTEVDCKDPSPLNKGNTQEIEELPQCLNQVRKDYEIRNEIENRVYLDSLKTKRNSIEDLRSRDLEKIKELTNTNGAEPEIFRLFQDIINRRYEKINSMFDDNIRAVQEALAQSVIIEESSIIFSKDPNPTIPQKLQPAETASIPSSEIHNPTSRHFSQLNHLRNYSPKAASPSPDPVHAHPPSLSPPDSELPSFRLSVPLDSIAPSPDPCLPLFSEASKRRSAHADQDPHNCSKKPNQTPGRTIWIDEVCMPSNIDFTDLIIEAAISELYEHLFSVFFKEYFIITSASVSTLSEELLMAILFHEIRVQVESMRMEFDVEGILKLMNMVFERTGEELLSPMNSAISLDPLITLSEIQETEVGGGFDLDPTISMLNIEAFSDLIETDSKCVEIFNKMVFDCINESLDRMIWRIELPWSNARKQRKIYRNVEEIQEVVQGRVLAINKIKAGRIAYEDSAEQVRSEQAMLQQREQGVVKILVHEIEESKDTWSNYEHEEVQAKLDLADMVLEIAIEEIIEIINNL